MDHWPWAGKIWNCKPYALQFLLKQGHPEVVWLDADLILANDCRRLFRTMPEDEIGVAEEQSTSPDQGTEIRTRGWQLPVGRKFPATMNSCVVRVTPRHLPLLRRWIDLLESDEYHRWKDKKKFEHMPPHVRGDQDVLGALLGANEFSDVPVRYFRHGVDVVHCGGALAYTVGERLRGLLHPTPCFFHVSGVKPWLIIDNAAHFRGFFWWYRRLLQETSPYVTEARRYKSEIGEPCMWLNWSTPLGLLVRLLGFGHFGLRGLPLAVTARSIEFFGHLRGRAK